MTTYEKPLPVVDEDTAPFWKYCKDHELRMQKCDQCGHIRYPPAIVCPKCLSIEAQWIKLSGRGKVYSFVIFRRAYKGFEKDVPYATAIIQLNEGPSMLSNIIACNVDDVRIDMPVELHFEDITDEFALPKFKPVE